MGSVCASSAIYYAWIFSQDGTQRRHYNLLTGSDCCVRHLPVTSLTILISMVQQAAHYETCAQRVRRQNRMVIQWIRTHTGAFAMEAADNKIARRLAARGSTGSSLDDLPSQPRSAPIPSMSRQSSWPNTLGRTKNIQGRSSLILSAGSQMCHGC